METRGWIAAAGLVGVAAAGIGGHADERDSTPDPRETMSTLSDVDGSMCDPTGKLFQEFGRQRGECGPIVVEGATPEDYQRICDGLAAVLRARGDRPEECDITTRDGRQLTLPVGRDAGRVEHADYEWER